MSEKSLLDKKPRKKQPLRTGGKYLNGEGYVMVLTGISQYRLEHVLIAENALGHHLDNKHPVHHHDGNKQNNAKSNLVICENNDYHKLLHARQRVVAVGGDPNTQKFCAQCGLLKPFKDFHKDIARKSGLHGTCRSCCRAKGREIYWRNSFCPKGHRYMYLSKKGYRQCGQCRGVA